MNTAIAKSSDLLPLFDGSGLELRGSFHPRPADGVPPLADGSLAGTVVLLGLVGHRGWTGFARSAEFTDGRPHPLDRWSRRWIDAAAEAVGGCALYPFGGPPYLPFQKWAMRAEPVFASPLGLLVHADWGLWHSYRGALALPIRLEAPEMSPRPHPCDNCAGRPCLSACPVGAFTGTGYDVDACAAHLRREDQVCMAGGCLARLACPVGSDFRHAPDQSAFYMRAFRAAREI